MDAIEKGIWVTMITPYTENGELDYNAVNEIVESYIRRGCNGIFAVCQSSEMFHLTANERVNLAKAVVEISSDRIQVVASGHVSDSLSDQIEELKAIWNTGVRALVLVTNRLAKQNECDAIWINNAQKLIDEIPEAIFGIYECPYPYKRLISDATLEWCVKSGRFEIIKDTSCDIEVISKRINQINELEKKYSLRHIDLFNANTMTLLNSLYSGASGYCGVMANVHPEFYCWLFKNYQKYKIEAEKVQSLLTLLSSLENQGYPSCAKAHMNLSGISISTYSRMKSNGNFGAMQKEYLRQSMIVEEMIAEHLVSIQ